MKLLKGKPRTILLLMLPALFYAAALLSMPSEFGEGEMDDSRLVAYLEHLDGVDLSHFVQNGAVVVGASRENAMVYVIRRSAHVWKVDELHYPQGVGSIAAVTRKDDNLSVYFERGENAEICLLQIPDRGRDEIEMKQCHPALLDFPDSAKLLEAKPKLWDGNKDRPPYISVAANIEADVDVSVTYGKHIRRYVISSPSFRHRGSMEFEVKETSCIIYYSIWAWNMPHNQVIAGIERSRVPALEYVLYGGSKQSMSPCAIDGRGNWRKFRPERTILIR